MPTNDQLEPETSPHPLHYQDNVRQITALGDHRGVVAREDIYSESGAKLLAKGSAINSNRQVLLLKQKLSKPLDTVVAISDGVDSALLYRRAEELLQMPVAQGGLQGLLWGEQALAALNRFPLCTVAANKLTLAHSDWKNLFDHGLRTALLCGSLAHQVKVLPDRETLLVGAGLLHDIGMLHLDPQLANDKDYRNELDTAQLERMRAHAALSAFIVGLGGYPEDLKACVEQHHERVDGSGYPQGVGGSQFSREAQLLAVAEILIGQLERGRIERWSVTIKNLASEHFHTPLCVSALEVEHAFSGCGEAVGQCDPVALAQDLRLLQKLSLEGAQLLDSECLLSRSLKTLLADFQHTGISSAMVPDLIESEKNTDSELIEETQALMGEYVYRLRSVLQAQEFIDVASGAVAQWAEQVRQLMRSYL